MNRIIDFFQSIGDLFAAIPEWLVTLATRLVIFRIFWLSVQTKMVGLTIGGQHFAFWSLTDNVFFQFWEYPEPFSYDMFIYAGVFAEFFFSIAILLGLFTRFAAIGLLVVVAVIQFVEPQAWWSSHVFWALLLIYVIRHGGGALSFDRIFARN